MHKTKMTNGNIYFRKNVLSVVPLKSYLLSEKVVTVHK